MGNFKIYYYMYTTLIFVPTPPPVTLFLQQYSLPNPGVDLDPFINATLLWSRMLVYPSTASPLHL